MDNNLLELSILNRQNISETLLSEYHFDIEIIKSDKNVLADFLTRDGGARISPKDG